MAKTPRKRNPSEPLPYFKWYPLSYRASHRVRALSALQRGLYRELLDECWLKGGIADDPPQLARVCGVKPSVFVENWPKIRDLFIEVPNTDGHFLTSERLEGERTQQDTVRVARSIAGVKSRQVQASASKRQQMPYSRSMSISTSTEPPFTETDEQPTAPATPTPQLSAVLANLKADRTR